MIHIAGEYGLGLLALDGASGAALWGSVGLFLSCALLLGLYLRERRLRLRDRVRQMERRDSELGALNALAGISSRTFDLEEILQSTVRCTRRLFAHHCDVLLFNPESGTVSQIETSRENRDQECEALRQMFDEDLAGYIARAHSELVTERDLGRLPPPAQKWIAAHGCQSFIAVLLYSHGKSTGILLISSSAEHQFTASDRNLAVAIARQLGNSVEKVLFYQETELAYQTLSNAQAELLHSEKMSAVGQLIAGVAHELNNPLTAILGYTQLLETEPIGERAQNYVRKLYLQTQRTHRVVQNLLSFSRQSKPMQSQVDLRSVLENSLALRDFDLKLNEIQVQIQNEAALPLVVGDARQLEQVFLNIINNAVDSIMDLGTGGSLKIRIFTENQLVYVEFRDTGTGIKDADKIFDPFYTTKEIGKGSGLGLSICYGIVKEHGGDILAFNHEEGGAVLQLKLPVTGLLKPV